MVRSTRSQLAIRRYRGRQAPTVIVCREESQLFGGGDPERINIGRRGGDDQRILVGRPKNMISSAEWHVVVFAMLGLLLGLMQVVYKNSPFDNRRITIVIFLIALCIYSFATTALLRFNASKEVEVIEEQHQNNTRHYYQMLDILARISAVVSTSCLVSAFVPADGLQWIVFVSCASIFCALVVAWDFLFQCIFRSANFGQGAVSPNMM